jgi:glycosyltransferase involved in cell wall biosynthesis
MKVVQLVTGSPCFGGAEAHVRDLAIGLISRGHECCVVVGGPEGLFHRQLRANGVPVIDIPPLQKPLHPVRDVKSLVQLLSVLRRLKPDILAAHTAKAGFIGRLAARLRAIPCVFTPHGPSFINRKDGRVMKHRLLLELLALKCGGTTIAVSEAERRLALTHLRIDTSRISLIHNGIPDCAPHRRAVDGPVRLTMLARFDHPKDHCTLLRALSALNHLRWELRLAGIGPLLSDVKCFAEECGISSRVRFLGECSDVTGLLADTDIFALISNAEAFPISILEAMRAALPVVATATGGICEAVSDGENGFLVAHADSSTLAEKLSVLIESPELRLKMGNSSRQRFLRNHEWNCMLDQTESLYAMLLRASATLRTLTDSLVP